MSASNLRVVLARPLAGVPSAEDFTLAEAPVPEPGAGEFLVRHVYLSLDPYQRPAMAGRHGGGHGPLGAGDMPSAETIGQVVKSRHPGFPEGGYVRHFGGWQAYSVSDGKAAQAVDPRRAPLSAYLGVLGMPGLTAWASAVRLAAVRAGQTVLVSAAAGPVGATFGQIAMRRGARAVGIAGSDEKCALVTGTYRFAACLNYKRPGFLDQLRDAAGEGFDCYHDNVGGQMLVDAMSVLRNYGTVVLCGFMADYNVAPEDRRFSFPMALPVLKRAVMKGLVVYDFEPEREAFFAEVAPWVAAGEVRFVEDRAAGLERAGAHFARLMRGENVGKALVVVGPEQG
jgi:NADPH-dependent curcumin reductase CurA